ncbi:MAG: preprotein translocase subunit SecE [Patescibacteria group bacterium]
MLEKITSFLQESKQELGRVNWPTGPETTRLTLIVIIMSLFVAFFLGALDFIFTYLLEKFFIG